MRIAFVKFALIVAVLLAGAAYSTPASAACKWYQTESSCIDDEVQQIERNDIARDIANARSRLREYGDSAPQYSPPQSLTDRLRGELMHNRWAARCKPVETPDALGVIRLSYAAPGCDEGPKAELDSGQ
jgi:hypothetical protein